MSELTSWQINQIPQDLINDIAMGVEDPVDVAFRHGFSASQFARLKEFKPFAVAVEKRKVELETSGFTAKVKAVLMSDPLMDKAFKMAMADGATLGQVLDVLKTMTRLGDLEPRGVQAAGAGGPGFSIVINIPKINASEKIVIDTTANLNLPDFSDEAIKVVSPDHGGGSDPVAEAGGSPAS